MTVERLFSVEFAKQGMTGESALTGSVASSATRGFIDVNRQRAYIGYSGPILRRLASFGGKPADERDLFKLVADDVKKADFQDFRLALAGLADQQFIAAAGQNEFGDLRYRITDAGMAVAPGAD